MNKWTQRTVLIFGLLPYVCAIASDSSERHVVAGMVVNSIGTPVSNAYVAAMPFGNSGVAGSVNWIPTDDGGRFRINLNSGRYVIRAKDERRGYPDPTFLLSRDPKASFPEITVRNRDLDEIRVVLGVEGGVLQIQVRDEDTQQQIPSAKAIIRDAGNTAAFVEVTADQTGHLGFTVPSKPIVVSAHAPGYGLTAFHGGEELVLSGGELRSITIDMRRQ